MELKDLRLAVTTDTPLPTNGFEYPALSYTHNDEQNEVDEVVEGVGIHDVVHNVHPALQCDHLGWETDRWTHR